MLESGPKDPFAQSHAIVSFFFKLRAPPVNQIIADVLSAMIIRSCGRGLPGQRHCLTRDVQLRCLCAFCDLLNNRAIAIASREVHQRVDAGGIASQYWIHLADALEEL